MKVSTRIVLGYGVLILLTVAVLAYQVHLIRQLHAINKILSDVNVENAHTAVNLQNDQETYEEFALKYFATGDPLYREKLREYGTDLEGHLKKLRLGATADSEKQAIERMSQNWKNVQDIVATEQKDPQSHHASEQLRNQLGIMRAGAERVFQATKDTIQGSAQRSKETAAYALRVSWMAGIAALMISILVAAPIAWSIASRLREMASATRVIAAGKFDHRLRAEGGDEFSDLARDFNTMARRLGELDQMKKDFVSHVSHDLKGPLASTRETVHLLMEEIPGPLNDRQRRLLGLCLKSSQRLSAMIGNLLDVSRMEAGMMDYSIESVDLVHLAHNAASEFEGLAHEKNVDLKVESAVSKIWAECDHGRITQVLGNLIENAIKFSPEASRVVLRVECKGEDALVSVWDRGPGVPRMSRDKIFDRFHQVNPGKKISGQGVGLGLSICRKIVEAHGGAI
ncbi:MAG TPA: HAMP domain-containing sensor histidine kinase, partial [Terriglobia bacterium]|nr:HAMP domain-containing sensor histidine kinase [Terriglobia bacterium]